MEFQRLVAEVLGDLQDGRILWQGGIVLLGIGIGLLVRYLFTSGATDATNRPRILGELWHALQFPVVAWVVVVTGRAALRHFQPVQMLNIVVPMLTALVIIRLAVVMLRQAVPHSGWVDRLAKTIGWIVWIGFVLHITGLAPDLIQFLDDLDFKVAKHRISLLLIIQATASVLVTMLLALWAGRFAEARLMGAETLDINLRVMLSKLLQALLLVVALLVALPVVGIDLTVLSVFGGMLGVGLGFGLQKIAANYVSGFIILMDRSVRIGDMITVDKYTGQLTKMTARYVVVRALTGTETLIPNETIIGSAVVNHSYTDSRIQIQVPVQVAYRTDLDEVSKLLTDLALAHPRVLTDKQPKVVIREFADSGINLELLVWIDDADAGTANLKSDLYFAIWRAFRDRGIEIPYPQREIRVLGTPADKPPAATPG